MDTPSIIEDGTSRDFFMGGLVPRSGLSTEESIDSTDAEALRIDTKADFERRLQPYLDGILPFSEIPKVPWKETLEEAFRPKKKVTLEFLKELDALLRPHLLPWCRLVFPMGYRSLKGNYWVVPQGMIKIHLLSGATWHLGLRGLRRRKVSLLLRGITPLHWWIGHTGEYYETAARSLKAWCLAQQNAPAVEEPPFHKPVEEVVRLFYYVMFCISADYKYEKKTARDLWKIFKKVHGPIKTKQEPDFNSSYRMVKFLHYCLENDPGHFRLTHKIDRTKKEVWEIRSNWSSSNPAIKEKLKTLGCPPGMMTVFSDEELWNNMLDDLLWEPPPVDLEREAHMARFRETHQPEWDNIRERIHGVNEYIRENGLLAYIEYSRKNPFWSE